MPSHRVQMRGYTVVKARRPKRGMVRRAQSRARMPRFPTTSYNKKGGTGQSFYQCFTLHAMLTELEKERYTGF